MARSKSKNQQYVVDEKGLVHLAGVHAAAWIGLLQAHKQLTRELDAELEKRHGLTISSLELLSRLGSAEDRTLRLTVLADQAGLSLSRVSRIVDALEARGLVERRPCAEDSRAKNAWLTGKGLRLLRTALDTHFAGVQELFFDRVSASDVETLARVFGPFRTQAV